MKTFLALVLAVLPTLAFAQLAPSTIVATQQTATRADAPTCVSASGTAQQTLTITPGPGQYVYLVSVEISHQATSAAAASAFITTTTNLGSKRWQCGMTAVAGSFCLNSFFPAIPIKSTTIGTAVTIVSAAAITNVNFTVDACYYFAQ